MIDGLLADEIGTRTSYSWDDLVRDGGTKWDGVRNKPRAISLRAMKPGDQALFYHSKEQAVVGIMEITGAGEPDGADGNGQGAGRAGAAAGQAGDPRPIKAEPRLAKMELIRQSRLSVAPSRRGMEADPGDERVKLLVAGVALLLTGAAPRPPATTGS